MITSDGCVVVKPGDGVGVRGASGAATLIKASGDETADMLAAFEQVAPEQSGPPLHIHHECGEMLYVIDGEFKFAIGSEVVAAPAGTFVFVPSGVPHSYSNAGLGAGRILFCFTPAGRMEGYFKELAALAPGHPTDITLDDIAVRHGVEIVRKLPKA